MYTQTAQWYDKIYQSMKDYGAETDKLTAIIREHRRSAGNRLLDVACGTGLHLSHLTQHFAVEGLRCHDDNLPEVDAKSMTQLRYLVRLERGLRLIIPLLAVLMARGIGRRSS